MLRVHAYDDISQEWSTHQLEGLPSSCRDPHSINHHLAALLGEDPNEPTWSVSKTIDAGPDLHIYCHDARGHLCRLLVFEAENYE